jgi:hypothetical protein
MHKLGVLKFFFISNAINRGLSFRCGIGIARGMQVLSVANILVTMLEEPDRTMANGCPWRLGYGRGFHDRLRVLSLALYYHLL